MRHLLSGLKDRFSRAGDGFFSNILVLAGATAAGQAIAVVVLPLLTRLFPPEEMGKFGLYSAFVSIASVFSCLCYETAIVSGKNASQAVRLVLGAVVLALVLSVLSALAYCGLVYGSVLGFEGLFPYSSVFVFLALLFSAAFQSLRYWYIREEAFGAVARATVYRSVVGAVSQALCGLAGTGYPGLMLGDLLGRTAGVAGMARRFWGEGVRRTRRLSCASVTRVLSLYKEFPLYSLPSSGINALALYLTLPLIAGVYGMESAGFFGLCQKVVHLPLAFVGRSVGDAFHGRIARLARESPGEARGFLVRNAGGLFALGIVPFGVLAVLGPRIFAWVFGESWRDAGALVSVMTPWALAQFSVSPLSRVVFVFSGQRLKLVYDILSLGGTLAIVAGSSALGLPLVSCVLALSLAQTGFYGVYLLLLVRVVPRSPA